jgi:hypothetical protein
MKKLLVSVWGITIDAEGAVSFRIFRNGTFNDLCDWGGTEPPHAEILYPFPEQRWHASQG